MKNLLFNQILSIDADYLQSVIATIFLNIENGNALTQNEFAKEFYAKLEQQEQHALSLGADTYPLVIDVHGAIIKYGSCFAMGTQDFISILREKQNNPNISGIVFNIDSGGGMVSGTAELCDVIKNYSKPTVAYTNGYMCSAAYDIAAACEKRVAHPTADLIGSIGTMLSYSDYSAIYEKMGAKFYELYATQSSEKNAEWRALKQGDEKLYVERLSYLAANFINRVKENLGEKLKDDGHVFKGKTYTPEQALEIGLIDQLGDLEQVLNSF